MRAWISRASEWLEAIEADQEAIRAEKLTPQEQRAAKGLARRKKLNVTKESAEKRIRSLRGEDYSDF